MELPTRRRRSKARIVKVLYGVSGEADAIALLPIINAEIEAAVEENKRLKHAIELAKLSLKAISEPGTLSPPDARVCYVIASGCLIRIENALRQQTD